MIVTLVGAKRVRLGWLVGAKRMSTGLFKHMVLSIQVPLVNAYSVLLDLPRM